MLGYRSKARPTFLLIHSTPTVDADSSAVDCIDASWHRHAQDLRQYDSLSDRADPYLIPSRTCCLPCQNSKTWVNSPPAGSSASHQARSASSRYTGATSYSSSQPGQARSRTRHVPFFDFFARTHLKHAVKPSIYVAMERGLHTSVQSNVRTPSINIGR